MSSNQQIAIYWRSTSGTRGDIVQALVARKFKIREAKTVSEVVELLEQHQQPLIISDTSQGESEERTRTLEMASIDQLVHCAAVFIGSTVCDRLNDFTSPMPNLIALEIPYSIEQAITQIVELYEKVRSASVATGTDTSAPITRSRRRQEHSLPLSESQRKLVSLGGAILASTDSSMLDAEQLVSTNPQQLMIIQTVEDLETENPWLGSHAKRTGALSSVACTFQTDDNERRDNTIVSSLLLNIGALEGDSVGPPLDLSLVKAGSDARRELAHVMRVSADFVRGQLRDERAARTIATVSNLLLGEQPDEEFSIISDAQSVLAAEFVDRGCWSDGYWNPRGAYRVIRNLRSTDAIISDEILLGVFTRIVGEALVANPRLLNAEQHANNSAEKEIEAAIKAGGAVIDMSDLSPGMRLMQPIKTLDGVTIVQSDLILDADIIRRIWQLAGIRAVNAKVVVELE